MNRRDVETVCSIFLIYFSEAWALHAWEWGPGIDYTLTIVCKKSLHYYVPFVFSILFLSKT